MKQIALLLISFFLIACSGNEPDRSQLFNEETPHKDLLQTIKNSYLNSNYDVSVLYGFKLNKHKKEIAESIKIADTFHISGYDQTLVLYSYSIGSDIIRETANFKKEDGKWFRTFLYSSSYDDDPFKDGNVSRAKEILVKEEKWNEESEELEKKLFGR